MNAPICIECAYAEFGMDGYDCRRPLSDKRSLVDGRLVDRLDVLAWNERRSGRTLFGRERCGPAGRFFNRKAAT